MLRLWWVLLPLFLASGTFRHEQPDYVLPESVSLADGDTFDYIVVGAGGAGIPAAARLALAGASVLLVEAGRDPNLDSRIPGRNSMTIGSDIDWQYPTITNNLSCLSYLGKQCTFSRGKCLGGSTSINFMMYVRGNRIDYDDLNIEGWAWRDLEPYFLKYEGLQDLNKLPPTSIPYHSINGSLKIGFFAGSQITWHYRTIGGYRFLNFPYNYDVNAESQIGVSQVIGYVYEGERMSTARGYLARDDVKAALKVSKNTHCTGVILDDHNNAIGINVVVKERYQTRSLRLYANEEVILSAGTIGTAQILMLSGIGPASHLNNLGIPVRVDLPVGDNISDHVFPEIIATANPSYKKSYPPSEDMKRWLKNRTGPLASNGIADIYAFLNTRCYNFDQRKLVHNSSECELPTMQLGNGLISPRVSQDGSRSGLNEGIAQQFDPVIKNRNLIIASPIVLAPFSRGNIRLTSRDPLEKPAIFPNFLADNRDIEEMLRGITIVEHLIETPEYKAINASILHLKLPDCPEYEVDREGYWRCYCRHMMNCLYHTVGSAPLGAVLDARLRVLGVERLRAADLSVLPKLPRGNTAAAAIAIGERVADFILQDMGILNC